jgi:DNA-binding NarL/FixJ family response regulator
LRVLLADDHGIVRRGLKSLLDEAGVSVVAEAADGLEAIRLTEEHRPDLLILDIAMPRLSGIDVAARSQKLERPPGVIILSMHSDESYIIRALAAGARAYLLKDATDEDLLPAVRAVASGKPFFSPAVTSVAATGQPRTKPKNGPKSRVAGNPVMNRAGTLDWKCSSKTGKPSASSRRSTTFAK